MFLYTFHTTNNIKTKKQRNKFNLVLIILCCFFIISCIFYVFLLKVTDDNPEENRKSSLSENEKKTSTLEDIVAFDKNLIKLDNKNILIECNEKIQSLINNENEKIGQFIKEIKTLIIEYEQGFRDENIKKKIIKICNIITGDYEGTLNTYNPKTETIEFCKLVFEEYKKQPTKIRKIKENPTLNKDPFNQIFNIVKDFKPKERNGIFNKFFNKYINYTNNKNFDSFYNEYIKIIEDYKKKINESNIGEITKNTKLQLKNMIDNKIDSIFNDIKTKNFSLKELIFQYMLLIDMYFITIGQNEDLLEYLIYDIKIQMQNIVQCIDNAVIENEYEKQYYLNIKNAYKDKIKILNDLKNICEIFQYSIMNTTKTFGIENNDYQSVKFEEEYFNMISKNFETQLIIFFNKLDSKLLKMLFILLINKYGFSYLLKTSELYIIQNDMIILAPNFKQKFTRLEFCMNLIYNFHQSHNNYKSKLLTNFVFYRCYYRILDIIKIIIKDDNTKPDIKKYLEEKIAQYDKLKSEIPYIGHNEYNNLFFLYF